MNEWMHKCFSTFLDQIAFETELLLRVNGFWHQIKGRQITPLPIHLMFINFLSWIKQRQTTRQAKADSNISKRIVHSADETLTQGRIHDSISHVRVGGGWTQVKRPFSVFSHYVMDVQTDRVT